MNKPRKPRKNEEVRPIVAELLRLQRIDRPPVPVESIAKYLGATVRFSPFKGELAGMLIRDDASGRVVIGVNSLHHANRQRFTIAHECGHLRLHEGRRVYVDRSFRVNRRDELSSQATDFEEIEANRFAAELLMPYDMFSDDIKRYRPDIEDENELRQLANRYGVSLQALTLRIQNVSGKRLPF